MTRFPDISEIEEVSEFLTNRWYGFYGFTITLRNGSIRNYYVFCKEGDESVKTLREAYDGLRRELAQKTDPNKSPSQTPDTRNNLMHRASRISHSFPQSDNKQHLKLEVKMLF